MHQPLLPKLQAVSGGKALGCCVLGLPPCKMPMSVNALRLHRLRITKALYVNYVISKFRCRSWKAFRTGGVSGCAAVMGVFCRGVECVFRGRKKPLLAILLVTCLLKQDTGVSCISGAE